MNYSLTEIRKSFGFSQEELAEKMGKGVSTIGRWERGKTKAPFFSPLVQTANRPYQYIKHMIDPELLTHVQNDEGLSGLYYGNEFFIICYSKGNLRRYPLLRASYGFIGASYLKGEGKRLYDENMDNLNKALMTPGSLAVFRTPGNSGVMVTEPYKIEFHFIGLNMVHAISTQMSDEEAAKCKVASIDYMFG